MTNQQAATEIVKKLKENGFQALLAGGCVRDMLLGRIAKDYDVATNARPEQVQKIFPRTIEVGAKFGVIIVFYHKNQVEVATFRTESGYIDGRHPQKVEFADAREDAARRDFTINGMFFDPLEEKVIDFVEGRKDLEKSIIRTIGQSRERFSEDYLRMLRAIRFSTRLDFEIEPETFAAITEFAGRIKNISGERIKAELEGTLTAPARSKGARLLVDSGLAKAIFPEITSEKAVFGIKTLDYLPESTDFMLSLGAFFADFSTKTALKSAETLKLSRNETKSLTFLLENRGKLLNAEMPVSQLKLIASEPYFQDLFDLQKAIQQARKEPEKPLETIKNRLEKLENIPLRPDPLLSGHDLMRLGAVQGPDLGRLARELYIAQLEGEVKTVEQAKEWTKKWLACHKED